MNKKTRDLLILHEGLRLKPYRCTKKKLTIGVGRNLDDVGISFDEAMFLLDSDIARVMKFVLGTKWFPLLNEARKTVIIDMIFNLGVGGFLEFKKFRALLENGDYEQASVEMMDSAWSKQVGERAERLSKMMKTGLYL